MTEKLDVENFDSFIENSDVPVFVDFYNDSCIPCKRIAPLISKAESEYEGKMKFAKVNIVMNLDLAIKLSVEAAPTLIIFNGGKEVSRHRGAANAEEFKNFIESIL